MKQLAFLIIPSTLTLKNIAHISRRSIWPHQYIFTILCISNLEHVSYLTWAVKNIDPSTYVKSNL